MQSSFRKLSMVNPNSMPTRQVHSPTALPPEVPQINPRELLLSLEKRLNRLGNTLEQVFQDQLELGRTAGYKQGYEDGRNEAASLVDAAAKELQALRGEKETFVREYKLEIIDLVVAICNKLLLEQIIKPEIVLPLVEDALINLNPPLDAVVYCHPEQRDALLLASENLAAAARGSVDIIADPLLPQHAVRVESENSVLGIDIIQELEAIARELGVELESGL